MKQKTLAYAFLPAVLGVGLLGVNIASAHGWFGGFGGFGMNATPDQIATRQQTIFQNEAQVLGVSVDTVKEAWAQGKSLQQIMQENNVSQDQIQSRMKDLKIQQMKSQLQTLVDQGIITQAQSDTRLQFMQTRIQNSAGHMGRGFFYGGFF